MIYVDSLPHQRLKNVDNFQVSYHMGKIALICQNEAEVGSAGEQLTKE
jgi:hypothetical protein